MRCNSSYLRRSSWSNAEQEMWLAPAPDYYITKCRAMRIQSAITFRPSQYAASVDVLATEFDEEAIAPSPDGRWLAYQSDEAGVTEVFIRPFPDTRGGRKWLVSSGGGLAPLWARDGSELYYLNADNDMMARRVSGDRASLLGAPEVLFRVPPELLDVQVAFYTAWDIAADGRFLMARASGVSNRRVIDLVVENWFEELRQKLED